MNFYTSIRRVYYSCAINKLLLIVRLIVILLTISFLQVSANGFAQKITINKKNAPLNFIIKDIRTQSGYDFIYNVKLLRNASPVTINVKNAELEEVLDFCFKNQPFSYTILTKTVIVKEKSLPEKVTEFFQKVDVSGKVLDEAGQPLTGATITIKGSSVTTTSNTQGEFILKNIDENAVLIISFIGYKTREITVGENRNLTIRMTIAPSELEKVTVVSTGYQTISKERATGAFNVVSKNQLEKPTTNIAQRLIGTTAGVQAKLDADGNPQFEIRGQTSLTANARPLVVVDGFAIQGDFSTINPNDVESVTILKDAAAASIWGARSANGVIVVVTKKAKRGMPLKVDFSSFVKVAQKLDLDYVNPLATSAQTIDYEMQSFGNWSAQTNPGSLSYVGYQWSPGTTALNEHLLGFITAEERDARLAKYRNQSNKQQIADELLTNPTTQQYNLSLSGSSEKLSNNLSLLYEDTKSNFRGTTNKKYTLNYRGNADVFKWLEFNFGALANYNQVNSNGVSLGDIQGISPYEMLRNDDASLTDISRYYTPILNRSVPTARFPYSDWTYNPIQEIANRKVTSEQLNTRLQTGLRFKIIKGLSFDSKVQYELFNTSNKSIFNDNTFQVRNAVNTAATWDQVTNKITLNLPKGGMLNQNRVRTETYNFRNQLNFDRRFGENHEVNFVAGSEINNVIAEVFGNPTTYGFNEQTLSVGTLPNGPGGTFFPIKNWMGSNQTFAYSNSYSYGTERYFSLFGNAAYTFNDKYTLSGSVRTDASNLITEDPSYRYAPFWSLGLGWQLGKESFMQGVLWLDRLNVRATYGYNGNVDRSTSFRPLIAMGAIPNTYTGDITATVSSFGNPTLRWEKTGTWNLGLDYSLFQGKLYGKVDVYNKSGKDLIATLSIPAVNGTTSQKLNNAEMTNRGIELELGTVQSIKNNDIVWRGNLNFSYNRNQITNLFVANYAASTLTAGGTGAYVEGMDANTLWRFKYAGMQNKQPMVYGANGTLYDFGAFTPGDGRNYLLNMGTAVAPYSLGFINSFKIHDFDLSFIVTGKFGHKFQRMGFNYPPTWTGRVLPNKMITEVMDGDAMNIVPLPQNLIEPRYYFWDRFHQSLSYLIENASHIRMQEVSLSYNIPNRLLTRFSMSRLQVFAQGNDLFTLVSNKAGEDPEYPMGTLKPQPRVSLGLKCEF